MSSIRENINAPSHVTEKEIKDWFMLALNQLFQTNVHKAAGLEHLMAHYGITADQLMALGDSGNDVEMLNLANYSYAMANASQIIKQHAKYLAPSHREDGVLAIIDDYLDNQVN